MTWGFGPIGGMDDINLPDYLFDGVDMEGIPKKIDEFRREGVELLFHLKAVGKN